MVQFIKLLDKSSSGKRVGSLFVLTNLIYGFMMFLTIPRTLNFAKDMNLLDMIPFGYDLAYVNDLFSALGEQGRHTYLTNQLPIDMVYPLLFALTYSMLLAYFLKKINNLSIPLAYVCILPIIAGLADYFENFAIIGLLRSYPELSEIAVATTATFSIIKSVATIITFLALLGVLVVFGYKAITKKKRKTA